MASSALTKVLITGAGTGFGHEAAMRLAEEGFDVIAAVEIYAQVQTLKRQAAERGVKLQVEKNSASKHAVEAIAETMAYELQEYNIEVATVNPGPFLTGFNDRMLQTWESPETPLAD
jgi:NAD(P)-dependent dehydrogenase (short-subunit alcohol dehydrogenase family)